MISKEQLAELVRLYSVFHGAIDPTHPQIIQAEEDFFAMLRSLHMAHAPELPFREFRLHAVKR